ncbi:DUF2585 family protein [Falsirhodobacter halotolerans]|uniref:DUF2585 family protein n=1 Tax=Falsirhodobacter halotolerans TaxID=1146892 RepID=UPI001FD0CC73|nr:DUF2585 family protein [Falsirhodobacter halotolerans]MCJ8139063.1 DUF2585 family protein [Falsirhodobacter halotolerans]
MDGSVEHHVAPSRRFPLPLAFIALAVAQVGALVILGRGWGAGCEGVFQMAPSPECNSQHPADAYSLLHVGFGMALAVLFHALRPAWPAKDIVLLVVFSSVLWEVAENLPPMIAMFGYEPGDPLAYFGDSIPNSIGDTLAAALGAFVAGRLHAAAVIAIVIAIEVGVSLAIDDGYVIALLRAFGAA